MDKKNTILVFIIVLIVSCSVSGPRVSTQTLYEPVEISGTWKLVDWPHIDSIAKAFPRGLPQVTINTENNTVYGFNGCNQLSGKIKYNTEDQTLQFFEVSATKMFCRTVPERQFSITFSSSEQYRVIEDTLILYKLGEKLMIFTKAE